MNPIKPVSDKAIAQQCGISYVELRVGKRLAKESPGPWYDYYSRAKKCRQLTR